MSPPLQGLNPPSDKVLVGVISVHIPDVCGPIGIDALVGVGFNLGGGQAPSNPHPQTSPALETLGHTLANIDRLWPAAVRIRLVFDRDRTKSDHTWSTSRDARRNLSQTRPKSGNCGKARADQPRAREPYGCGSWATSDVGVGTSSQPRLHGRSVPRGALQPFVRETVVLQGETQVPGRRGRRRIVSIDSKPVHGSQRR